MRTTRVSRISIVALLAAAAALASVGVALEGTNGATATEVFDCADVLTAVGSEGDPTWTSMRAWALAASARG